MIKYDDFLKDLKTALPEHLRASEGVVLHEILAAITAVSVQHLNELHDLIAHSGYLPMKCSQCHAQVGSNHGTDELGFIICDDCMTPPKEPDIYQYKVQFLDANGENEEIVKCDGEPLWVKPGTTYDKSSEHQTQKYLNEMDGYPFDEDAFNQDIDTEEIEIPRLLPPTCKCPIIQLGLVHEPGCPEYKENL